MFCLWPARSRSAPWSAAAALLVCSVAGAAPQPSRPAKGTVAVVELQTPPTMIGLGAQVLQNVEAAARAQGDVPLMPEELAARLGPEGSAKLQKCEGRASCLVGVLAPLGVDRIVSGSLGRDEKSYLLKLVLLDAKTGELIADVDRSILIASRRFQRDVAEAVPRLLRGEREARGTLRITSNVKNATVWIGDAPVGKTPVEVELKPGKHEVRLEKKAYLPIRRLVDVYAQKVTSEEFRLILEPGGVPEEEELPPLVARASPQEEAAGLQIHPPAWAAFGAAALAGGAGAFFGVRSEQGQSALQSGFDPDTQIYQGTRLQALEAQSQAKTANVLFGVAGAAAAVGILFTVLEVGGEELTATPAAAPGAASLRLEGRF